MVNLEKLTSYDIVASPSFREAKVINFKKLEKEQRRKKQELRKKKIKEIIYDEMDR